jgi:hypothetical protein
MLGGLMVTPVPVVVQAAVSGHPKEAPSVKAPAAIDGRKGKQAKLAGKGTDTVVVVQTLRSLAALCFRLFIILLAAMVVVVPAIAYKHTDVGAVLSGTFFGLGSVLPITVHVLRAIPGQHTHTHTHAQ